MLVPSITPPCRRIMQGASVMCHGICVRFCCENGVIQVDPLDNAVVICIEEHLQQGVLAEQVANTLRRLFGQGDIDIANAPLYCFSLQVTAVVGCVEACVHAIYVFDESMLYERQPVAVGATLSAMALVMEEGGEVGRRRILYCDSGILE